jgi:PKD repeat protein
MFYHIPSTPPVADFTAVPRAGPVSLHVQFSDASSDATSWSWDFGDGSPASTVQSPAHSYTTAGTYGVKLAAANSFGTSTAQKNNYITAGSFVPGFLASYYRGQIWSELAGTRTDAQIQFTDQGGSTWPITMVGRQDDFSVSWDGYINVPADADYSFRLSSDDGSWLWVDEIQVIDNGGDHASQSRYGSVHLVAGYHHIVVRMYENGGAAVSDLDYAILPSAAYSPVTDVYHMP